LKRILPYSSLLQPAKLRSVLSFGVKGYLAEIGWFNTWKSKSPVDENGNPIPWVTYSFIDFIRDRITKEHSVFEFGSGNSTLFYARLAAKVVSVEHDRDWFNRISAAKPVNTEMIFCSLVPDGDYCRSPLSSDRKFDVIIVDGRDRVNCCMQAVAALTDKGVIVLDDSERQSYQPAIQSLLSMGFRQLPFTGISPGLFYRKSTTVFYRSNNCLNI